MAILIDRVKELAGRIKRDIKALQLFANTKAQANGLASLDAMGKLSYSQIPNTVPYASSADTAGKLSTARKINNVSFDGAQDVTLLKYTTRKGVTANYTLTEAENNGILYVPFGEIAVSVPDLSNGFSVLITASFTGAGEITINLATGFPWGKFRCDELQMFGSDKFIKLSAGESVELYKNGSYIYLVGGTFLNRYNKFLPKSAIDAPNIYMDANGVIKQTSVSFAKSPTKLTATIPTAAGYSNRAYISHDKPFDAIVVANCRVSDGSETPYYSYGGNGTTLTTFSGVTDAKIYFYITGSLICFWFEGTNTSFAGKPIEFYVETL